MDSTEHQACFVLEYMSYKINLELATFVASIKMSPIANSEAHRRHGSDVRGLPRRGTKPGSDGQQGPFPRGYASRFQARVRR